MTQPELHAPDPPQGPAPAAVPLLHRRPRGRGLRAGMAGSAGPRGRAAGGGHSWQGRTHPACGVAPGLRPGGSPAATCRAGSGRPGLSHPRGTGPVTARRGADCQRRRGAGRSHGTGLAALAAPCPCQPRPGPGRGRACGAAHPGSCLAGHHHPLCARAAGGKQWPQSGPAGIVKAGAGSRYCRSMYARPIAAEMRCRAAVTVSTSAK